MATKKLARTVIEGGRRNVYERRHSHREERADTRQFVTKVIKGMDADELPTPRIRPVKPEFSDKLNPARRWMASRSGMLWSEVKSELHRKFDGPWPNQHVIYQHMLRDVVNSHEPNVGDWRRHHEFVVTPDGVFHKPVPMPSRATNNRRRIKERFTYRSTERVKAWLKERYVENVNDTVVWVIPWTFRWDRCPERWCSKEHREFIIDSRYDRIRHSYQKDGFDYDGLDRNQVPLRRVKVKEHKVVTIWRRGGKLNDRERQFWKTLHPRYKERILKREF